MAVYNVHGKVYMDIYVEVEAESIEDAIDICEGDISVNEYVNDTVGVEWGDCDIEEVQVAAWGNEIEWEECA